MSKSQSIVDVFTYAGIHKLILFSAVASLPLWDTSSLLVTPASNFIAKYLVRLRAWDNVYFTSIAQRGAVYEHEYAFNNWWPQLIRFFSPSKDLLVLQLTAVVLSILSHFAAIYMLLKLTEQGASKLQINKHVAAKFYTLYLAGIFMVNGYSESIFALISFIGLYFWFDKKYLLSGGFFALSTKFRSNGLIWGALFLVQLLLDIITNFKLKTCARLILGGLFIFFGFVRTQISAYFKLCGTSGSIGIDGNHQHEYEWCNNTLPSIYMHVQKTYWGNGLFHYWTLDNIPNFLFALPSVLLLFCSILFLLKRKYFALAVVHAILLVGAITSWHVQILTRISSCLPGPAWYLASLKTENPGRAKFWITVCVGWTIVQAALFGAFMPPA